MGTKQVDGTREGEAKQWQRRRASIGLATGVRLTGMFVLGAVGAGDVVESASQEALGWGADLNLRAVTRPLHALIWTC